MDGRADGGMWIQAVIGGLVAVLLVVVIKRPFRKQAGVHDPPVK